MTNLQPIIETEAAQPLTAQSLPYAFAKRHGVLIGQLDSVQAQLMYRDAPNPQIISEVRRIFARPLQLSATTAEQFEALLAQTYETNSGQTMAMM